MSSPEKTYSKADNPFGLEEGEVPTIEDVAQLIGDGKAKRILIMAGAGISTAAGIPDFRSPETGLYANLQKYDLPCPEDIFDIEYLVEKPQAFYTLAKELYPGNFKPTLTHYWFKLLADKGLLKAVFTQNIDTLERIAGLDSEHVIEAHGSFESAECIRCKKAYTKEAIKPQIMRGEVVYCDEKRCKGRPEALVKPKIVFFGEGLPKRFFDRLSDFSSADLLLVLGTSLSVQPFASLVNRVRPSCPRVLLNLQSVGEAAPYAGAQGFDFDGRTEREGGIRDVRGLGTSDEGVEKLCRALGWWDELVALKERGWAGLEAEQAEQAEQAEEEGSEGSEEEEEAEGEAVEKEDGVKEGGDDVAELTAKVGGVKLEETEDVPAPPAGGVAEADAKAATS